MNATIREWTQIYANRSREEPRNETDKSKRELHQRDAEKDRTINLRVLCAEIILLLFASIRVHSRLIR
jgi:hypothetical protein